MSSTTAPDLTRPGVSPLRGSVPLRPPPVLAPFVAADVLHAADVHVAARLAELAGCRDPAVLLGAALAVRAPRLGHVCVDITAVAGHAVPLTAEDAAPLAWPDADSWRASLAASPLVAVGDDPATVRPLRLVGDLLYLDRNWRDERLIAADLLTRADQTVPDLNLPALREGLDSLFAPDSSEQQVAAATAVLRRLTVIAGGPGTGKTTTIARILALLDTQPGGLRPRLVALAAPTGKAAARMAESVNAEAEELPVPEATRARLREVTGVTLHRLLGARPGSTTRFRHCADNRLPHEVVIIDEASMMPLALTARLLEALRDDARLLLVGDPDQLASVEAGAVLGDIVGPARDRPIRRAGATAALAEVLAEPPIADEPDPPTPVGDGIVVLRRVHRFGGGIARLADAIRRGDADAAIDVLRDPEANDVTWLELDPATATDDELAELKKPALAAAQALVAAARDGDAASALAHLGDFRLLCPHRRGPYGAETWGARLEDWLRAEMALPGAWYPGKPLIVTENDYAVGLFNGDTGVIVDRPGGPVAAFDRGGRIVELSPRRLAAVQPVHAMTVHKSQGSQFTIVGLVVAPADSPISTRELLYTAVTRAQERVVVLGEGDAIGTAVDSRVARASGLLGALWAHG